MNSSSISPTEFKERLSSLQILDIRTPYEIEDFDIGGMQIPLDELLLSVEKIAHLQQEEIIIVCYSGLQSEIARKILAKKGFQQLKNLEGGLEAFLNL
ncbi:rhodanese-like domain-containing protein [Arcicella rosea]|uniref:Adenylyltransferase/sulfurtransferase n=1 Tax=Arcicella rosea TaxID=502909 RepID=A0A841EUF6_9BACT|nr:rhodanese-like domain-containing protein [Arcicella rosea]MBB6003930.1 adenylyltransferase/sulfurtransferase [Arcicella rosea]